MTGETVYCGYIAFVGLPNAGKSTLLNACIRNKIAGVSKRPQTTRNKILGVETISKHQLIFVDTPGIQRSPGESHLAKAMHEVVWSSVNEADIVCYLVDGARGWTERDKVQVAKIVKGVNKPILVLASKADSIKKHVLKQKVEEIRAGMMAVQEKHGADKQCFLENEPYVFSAKRPESIKELKKKLAELLPEGPWLFDEDAITDSSEEFILAELIREQLFRKLGDEVPFGCGVVVDRISEGKMLGVAATIIVDNASHKKIIIGKAGETLKGIGTLARQSIEQYYEGRKVFLELFVRVEKGWLNRPDRVLQVQKLEG